MAKTTEDQIRLALVTLSKERARLSRQLSDMIIPPWLESSIYQLELALGTLEGSRLAAKGLQATVEEILDIVDHEHGGGCGASREIRERFEALLRLGGADEEG